MWGREIKKRPKGKRCASEVKSLLDCCEVLLSVPLALSEETIDESLLRVIPGAILESGNSYETTGLISVLLSTHLLEKFAEEQVRISELRLRFSTGRSRLNG